MVNKLKWSQDRNSSAVFTLIQSENCKHASHLFYTKGESVCRKLRSNEPK